MFLLQEITPIDLYNVLETARDQPFPNHYSVAFRHYRVDPFKNRGWLIAVLVAWTSCESFRSFGLPRGSGLVHIVAAPSMCAWQRLTWKSLGAATKNTASQLGCDISEERHAQLMPRSHAKWSSPIRSEAGCMPRFTSDDRENVESMCVQYGRRQTGRTCSVLTFASERKGGAARPAGNVYQARTACAGASGRRKQEERQVSSSRVQARLWKLVCFDVGVLSDGCCRCRGWRVVAREISKSLNLPMPKPTCGCRVVLHFRLHISTCGRRHHILLPSQL